MHSLKQKQKLVYLYIFLDIQSHMKNMDRTFLLFTRKRGFFLGKEASHFAYDHISAPFISQWRREKLRQQLLHIDALKFVFSKKATKLSIWHLLQNVKSTVKISSIFVASLENMNFIHWQLWLIFDPYRSLG